MKRPFKFALILAGALVALLVVLVVAGLIVLRSAWFHDYVRDKMVAAIEKATGGRTEIGGYAFDWRSLTAQVNGFVLHGTETDAPPLFQAQTITARLKIISLLEKKIDLEAVDVKQPRIRLIVHDDGSTNIPSPKLARPARKGTLETIVDLAVKQFSIEKGLLLLREEKTPFDIRGENLRLNLGYSLLPEPRYAGEVRMEPLYFALGKRHPTPIAMDVNVAIDRSRIHFESKRLALEKSSVQVEGDVTNLPHAEVRFRYRASADLEEIQRMLELDLKPRGSAQASGTAFYAGAKNFRFEGDLHTSRLSVDLGAFHVRDTSTVSTMLLDPERLRLDRLRLSTSVNPPSAPQGKMLRVEGEVGEAELGLASQDLDLRRVRLATLGGTFEGAAQFRKFERFHTEGTVAGFDARTLLAIYSPQTVPWDGLISGAVQVEGSLKAAAGIVAAGNLTISPAPGSEPVHGVVTARYDSKSETLDLGDSTLTLPATSLHFAGVLGQSLKVSVDSKNLDEIWPAVGMTPPPLRLQNGEATFTGTVSGKLEAPQIAGHAAMTNFVYDGRPFDALAVDVNASPAGVKAQNGSIARGAVRAQFQGSVGLADWKTSDTSSVAGSAAIANAPLGDLLALADQKDVPVSGTLKASATVSGTIGNPAIAADLDLAKGAIKGEPFDRLTAKVSTSGNTVQVSDARLTAGKNQITASATYQHATGDFRSGRAQFQVASNAMALGQLQTIVNERPDVKGTVQVTASGAAAITPQAPVQLTALKADVAAHGLALGQQAFGDAHLTASTEGQTVVAHLDSDFTGAKIAGDGRWQLADGYPGSAKIEFSNLDFARLRDWLAPPKESPVAKVMGSAQGSVTIDGPALEPAAWKASLTIPTLQLRPAPNTVPAAADVAALSLHNTQPIQVTMQNDVIRLVSAHFAGNHTDLTLGGTVSPKTKNQLDLQVTGNVNLGVLHTFNPDLIASGQAQADAGIRGTFRDPQVTGKLQLKQANLNYQDFPNGISNAQGTIVFSGTRATIQSLTAETGGGKVNLTGFAGYSGGEAVFRVQADATDVRLRYPEGVSTVANVSLTLSGSSAGSLLAGTITIERLGFNPRTDLASVLAKSSEPEQAPSAQTGVLANMQLDIQIAMAPDVTFQSTLAQNIQADANLRLRGTPLNPALLGRIVITQGQIAFFGTKFTIDQGSISFYNPVKIEPVLDIDFETKARGVDVILTVSGPLSKLNLTPRSDPPLQFSEIVALLATGNAPASDPNLAIQQQGVATQSFQQLGASALLGQALANPVSGRLQRFFGVTKLRIDPSFQGVENNPQARLTIEQAVTPDITFTYITNITNSNPQVVRVEWALNKRWSVVALREENGLFGIDFLYKKRFK